VEILFYPYDNINLINLLLKTKKNLMSVVFSASTQLEENIKESDGELPSYMEPLHHSN
jgi:hypothetical protein